MHLLLIRDQLPDIGIVIAKIKVATENSPAPKPINRAPIKNNTADPNGAEKITVGNAIRPTNKPPRISLVESPFRSKR